jgi:hypothetical protein
VSPEQKLRKAAKRLRKAVAGVNRWEDETLGWQSVLLPPDERNKRPAFWVQENTTSGSGGEGARTVADVIWNLDDAVYIALMHPPVALLLADLLDGYADQVKMGIGMSGDMKKAVYSPGSLYDYVFKLADEINRGWKKRAKRDQ